MSVINLCVTFLVLVAVSASSLPQPWPIKVEKTGLCCATVRPLPLTVYDYNATEVSHLKECLGEQNVMVGRFPVSVIIYGTPGTGDFAIPDIEQFAVYQRAIVMAYAENNRYSFRNMGGAVDVSVFEGIVDSRWFKIKLLLDALHGYAKDDQYIVWIDADAVVLDFGLRIEDLGAQYPVADVLASADIRVGLINTGVLVLRNTPWLRQFLHYWWYGPPGQDANGGREWRSVCDQDAFDRLYSYYASLETAEPSRAPKISDKVRVLAMDALNSHPPAMLHQQEHSPVLHLMGEATAMRRELFRLAWSTSICGARSGGVLPVQLGLNREVILSYARLVYGEEVSRLLEEAKKTSLQPVQAMSSDLAELEAQLVAPLAELSTAAHHFCDILQHLHQQQQRQQAHSRTARDHERAEMKKNKYQQEQLALRTNILDLVLSRAGQVKAEIALLTEMVEQGSELSGAHAARRRAMLAVLVHLLKRGAEAGNDVFGAAVQVPDKLRAGGTVFELLEELLLLVEEDSRFVPLHMKALLHQSLGLLEHNLALSLAASQPSVTPMSATSDADHGGTGEGGSLIHTKALVDSHMQEAAKHLAASVAIFKENKRGAGAAAAEDSTTLMEESLSLQLLAGVTCSLGRYKEGVRLWGNAVTQARHSLHGLHLGVRYDNLASVLYNAAVCNHAAQKSDIASALVSEAITIMSRADAADSRARSTLLQAAEELMSSLRGTHPQPAGTGSRAADSAPSNHQATTSSAALVNRADSAPVTMRPVEGTGEGPRTYVRHSPAQTLGAGAAEGVGAAVEQEEWVECELDEDCEYFDVLLDPLEAAAEVHSPNTAQPPQATQVSNEHEVADHVESAEVDALDGIDTEGMTQEEVDELREVRSRYARQAAQRQKLALEQVSAAQRKQAEEQEAPVLREEQQILLYKDATADAATITMGKYDTLAAVQSIVRHQGELLLRLAEQLEALRQDNRDLRLKLEQQRGAPSATVDLTRRLLQWLGQ